MRIGTVIGTVTLATSHPLMRGAAYRITIPLSWENLTGNEAELAEPLVVFDDLGAGVGERIAFSEGGEAAQPFYPDDKPIDAYCAALLDAVTIGISPGQASS